MMVTLRAIGEARFEISGTPLAPDSEVAFAALLYLTVEAGNRVSRAELLALLWPAATEERARHNLRQTLYKLRSLGAQLDTTQTAVRLPRDVVDADFVAMLAPETVAAAVGHARALAGTFLPNYAPTFSPRFAEWVDQQRDYVHSCLRRVLLAAISDARARGRYGDAELFARRCLLIDPLNEEATLALAEAAAYGGGKSQALQILDRYIEEIGPGVSEIRLPAALLRKRIAERMTGALYTTPAEVPMVGRDASMNLLTDLLRSAKARQGRACLLWGPPGIGKTRLTTEFARLAALQGAHVQRAVCQPVDASRPLSALVSLVPGLQTLPGALGCAPESIAYLRRLTEHDTAATEPSADAREAETLHANVRRAVFDLFDAVASEGLVIVVVENAHWLDRLSWRFIADLVAWSADRRLLWVLTSRDDRLGGREERIEIAALVVHEVPALELAAGEELIAAMAAERNGELPPAIRRRCIEVAEGNPYFIRELAAQWLDRGESAIPQSLRMLVDARVAILGHRARRVLQSCAVLGEHSTIDRLESLLEYTRVELLDAVEALDAAALIAMDGPRLVCKHDLIAESALARLRAAARKLLHRDAGLTLERELTATPDASLLWDCAKHWQLAGQSDRAIRLAKQCAKHALEVGLPNQAVEILERAVTLCASDQHRAEIDEQLAKALELAGRWEQLEELGVAILSRPRHSTATPPFYFDIEISLLQARWRTGARREELLANALRCLTTPDISTVQRLRVATIYLALADEMVAEEKAHDAYRYLREFTVNGTVEYNERLRVDLVYHTAFGDLEKGVIAARELKENLECNDIPLRDKMRALRHGAVPLRSVGMHDESNSWLEEAYHVAMRFALPFDAAMAAAARVTSALVEQDPQLAAKWQKRLNRIVQGTPALGSIGTSLFSGVLAALAVGDYSLAAATFVQLPVQKPGCASLRERAEYLALRLRLICVQPSPVIAEDDVAELWRYHQIASRTGAHDFVFSTLFLAMTQQGKDEEAQRLLRDYVTHQRRDRFRLPVEMASAVASMHTLDK